MSYLVLSDQARQNLEQERSRLMGDREKIVAEIESSVTAEVDQTIQALNALLNEVPIEVAPTDEIVEAVTEILDHSPTETETKMPRSRKTGTKRVKLEPKEQSAFDATQLKRKFKGKKPIDAIVQLLQQDPEQIHTIDDLITDLYGKFDEAEMSRARKTLGATLMHATRAGTVERVGDKPSRFKLGQSAAIPA
jgi:hypothetical protein